MFDAIKNLLGAKARDLGLARSSGDVTRNDDDMVVNAGFVAHALAGPATVARTAPDKTAVNDCFIEEMAEKMVKDFDLSDPTSLAYIATHANDH